jgi:hypothetical protein
MSEYDNRGALWKNDKREKDTHPQMRGQAEVNGVEYWVSAWTSSEGGKKPLVSLSFTPKEAKQEVQTVSSVDDDFDSDLPF